MQQGQIITNKNGDKRKILGVCGEVYILSYTDVFDIVGYMLTEKEIKDSGYTVL